MGSRIAAHFANAGFPVDLLDIVQPDQPKRNAAALAGIESAAKQRPVAFFTDAAKALITPGNFEDDLGRVGRCEWIVEAVAENLEIKRSLWRRVAALRAPGSIVSTNTSGIPLAQISEGFDSEFRQHFLGTHFFNPPRYLHLAEVIAGRGNAARKFWTGSRSSAICTSARAWCRARIRPTSSAIASAASSARRSANSPKSAISPWRRWTR